ncbi:hypothetical protein MBR_09927, partial [Metarhizium brunneum ARSEF 3297]
MASTKMNETEFRFQLNRCRLHLEATHASLQAVHGDLRYLQVALDEVASEVKRLARDNDLLLSCLNHLVDWDEDDWEGGDSPKTPKPPTTPTTPCTPWGPPKEELTHDSGSSGNSRMVAAGAAGDKPRSKSM